MKTTNYYVGQDGEQLSLRILQKPKKGRPKRLGINTEGMIINLIPAGLCSFSATRTKYMKMLEVWGIEKMSNEEIFKEFHDQYWIARGKEAEQHYITKPPRNEPILAAFDTNISLLAISDALALYFCANYSLEEVSIKTKIPKNLLAHHIRYLKFCKRFTDNLESKTTRRRNKKRISKVIQEIGDIIKSKLYLKFTISSIQEEFNAINADNSKISRSTWRRVLTWDLKFSYKKWGITPFRALTSESTRWYFESAALFSKMKQQGIEIIFFDGFSLDMRSLILYHWSKRGISAYLALGDSKFHMSFIIGLSNLKIYGLLGVEGITNSSIVIKYLSEMISHRNNDLRFKQKPFLLWMDNASVHVSFECQAFLTQRKLRAVTITLRCPSLNPTEKLIACFKKPIVEPAKLRW